jgi:cytidylate kinase
VYLDTGAMYRTVALGFLRAEADISAEAARQVLPSIEVGVTYEEGSMHVFLNGADVTDQTRGADVGEVVSQISSLRPVRERMVREQQRIGREQEDKQGGVVLDGRDTGTVVFPDAGLKIFMVADLDERARRRQQEYAENGKQVPFPKVKKEIEERDRRDRTRDLAPLRQADDAVTLDTTERTVDEQIDFVVDRVKAQRETGT